MARQVLSVLALVATLLLAAAQAVPHVATQRHESRRQLTPVTEINQLLPVGTTLQCFTTPCPQPEKNYTIRADYKACRRGAAPRIEQWNETSMDWDRRAAPFAVQYPEANVAQFSVPSLMRGRIVLTDGDYATSRPVNLLLWPRAYLGGEATQAAGYGPEFEPRRHTANVAYLPRGAGLGLVTPNAVSSVKFADTQAGTELKAGERRTLFSSSADDNLVSVTWCR